MNHFKRQRGFLLSLLLLSVSTLSAQMDYFNTIFIQQTDSLKKVLAKHPEKDTVRINTLINILDCAVFSSQRRQVLPYWQEALQLSRKLNYKQAEADCLSWRGSFYKSAQQNDSAFIYFDSAIALAGNSSDTWMKKAKGFSQYAKGMMYESTESFYSALNNYFESLKSYDGLDLIKQKVISLRIADIYKKLHNDGEALVYYEAALQFYETANGKKATTESGGINACIAGIYFDRGDFPKASYYLSKISASMPDTTETMATGTYYQLAGLIALKEKNADSALILLKQSLKYFDYTREVHADQIASVSADIARLQMEKGNMMEAKKYATQSLESAKQSGRGETMATALAAMAEYDNKSGNLAAAYQSLYQATILKDSVLAKANIKQAATLSAIYENNKKEKEIVQLETDKKIQSAAVEQKSLLNTIFIITIAGLLITGSALYGNFRTKQNLERQKITQLESEKQLMAVEAMLKGQEEERARLAKDLHDGLGGMLSGVKISFSNMKENVILDAANVEGFEKAIKQLDNTIGELRKISHNLMPEAVVKFGLKSAVKDFCDSIQSSGNVNIICEQLGIERELGNIADVNVYRIIQELVNNAVKYSSAGQILVQLTKTPDKVLITVEDNGKGFDVNMLEKSAGIGFANIKYRVNYLNGRIEIHSAPGDGTTVNIELTA